MASTSDTDDRRLRVAPADEPRDRRLDRRPFPPQAWFSARGRNAPRRVGVLVGVGTLTFVVTVLALLLAPRQASRLAARRAAPAEAVRPDTAAASRAVAAAARDLGDAERALAGARAAVPRPVAPPPPAAVSPELARRRDSVATELAALTELLTRAVNAPLASSYRALGAAPAMRADPRARVLLDSLAGIERDREAFDAAGGVDPLFVALTARATAVGRSLQAVGESRRAALRAELARLRAPIVVPPPALAAAPPPDSLAASPGDSLAAGDSLGPAASPARAARAIAVGVAGVDTVTPALAAVRARDEVARSQAALVAARARALRWDRQSARARQIANVSAPPHAMIGAALVLALALGFGAAFVAELRRPVVAGAREAERVAGVRVLAVLAPSPAVADRVRRRADQEMPDVVESTVEGYRLLYLHFAATGATVPLLTVTGDDAAVVATVAANLAAASAQDARTTLLVDGDAAGGAVAAVFRLRPDPGVAGVLRHEAEWAEAIVTTPVGRTGTVDVVPSGTRGADDPPVGDDDRRDLARYAARYDFSVLVARAEDAERAGAALLPSPDVLVCARVRRTEVRWLVGHVRRLRAAGTRVRGIVLWDAEPPVLPDREVLANAGRTPRREPAAV